MCFVCSSSHSSLQVLPLWCTAYSVNVSTCITLLDSLALPGLCAHGAHRTGNARLASLYALVIVFLQVIYPLLSFVQWLGTILRNIPCVPSHVRLFLLLLEVGKYCTYECLECVSGTKRIRIVCTEKMCKLRTLQVYVWFADLRKECTANRSDWSFSPGYHFKRCSYRCKIFIISPPHPFFNL